MLFTFGRSSQRNHQQVTVDHLQSRGTPCRLCTSDVKVRGTLSKMDVSTELNSRYDTSRCGVKAVSAESQCLCVSSLQTETIALASFK